MNTCCISSNSSTKSTATTFFRCSACCSLIQRFIPIPDFLKLVEAKRISQQQGTINQVTPTVQPAIMSSSSCFRTQDAPHNLCIFPQRGIDCLELAGVRWGTAFDRNIVIKSKNQNNNNNNNEQVDHGLCRPSSPVTLLSSGSNKKEFDHRSDSSSSSSSIVSLSSGPLLIDGLDHHAEILMELRIDDDDVDGEGGKEELDQHQQRGLRYGQYHLRHLDYQVDDNDETMVNDRKIIKTSRTLFGSNKGGPVLVHAQPCPLLFDKFCQVAVSKPFKPSTTSSVQSQTEEAPNHKSSSSFPISTFVRKLASATVVICRVPRREKENNGSQQQYDHYVLLTQRQHYMRTFPSFFVVPGGGFDAHDGTLENAARRELLEEVSLAFKTDNIPSPPTDDSKKATEENKRNNADTTVDAHDSSSSSSSSSSVTTMLDDGTWTWEGCWESCFPTHPDHAEIQNASCPVRGHIVFFFSVVFDVPSVEDLPRLKPQSEEVASAKWYRVGPDVDAIVKQLEARKNGANGTENASHSDDSSVFCDFGEVPPITEYFQEMKLDPQRVELTLELQEELRENDDDDGAGKQDETRQVQKTTNLGQRMQITAGTEFFIARVCERINLLEKQ